MTKRQVRLEPEQVKREVKDLSTGEVGFVRLNAVYATRPDQLLWVFGEASVYGETHPSAVDVRIKRLSGGIRVFAPAGTVFSLYDDHGPDDLPVNRLDFEEAEDEEKAGEP